MQKDDTDILTRTEVVNGVSISYPHWKRLRIAMASDNDQHEVYGFHERSVKWKNNAVLRIGHIGNEYSGSAGEVFRVTAKLYFRRLARTIPVFVRTSLRQMQK